MNNNMLKCKVVMLTTQSKSNMWEQPHNGKIIYSSSYLGDCGPNAKHLYIVSDREIKDGDWYMFGNAILRASHDKPGNRNTPKIEATTDPELNIGGKEGSTRYYQLPGISKDFIQKYVQSYNDGKVIEDILVTIQTYFNGWKGESPNYDIKIITRDDNTVIIKPVKDSWTRQEIHEILTRALGEYKSPGTIRQWFDNNY